jgi:hypothetical protein
MIDSCCYGLTVFTFRIYANSEFASSGLNRVTLTKPAKYAKRAPVLLGVICAHMHDDWRIEIKLFTYRNNSSSFSEGQGLRVR